MNDAAYPHWLDDNQQHLQAHLARLRHALELHTWRRNGADGEPAPWLQPALPAMSIPPAIDTLCALFKLSDFERDLLLLCAGVELDGPFSLCCSAAQGVPGTAPPTFGLALEALPGAYWMALSPQAPLRFWRLVDMAPDTGLTQAGLRIDERILHYLTGVHYLDDWLASLVRPLASRDAATPSQSRIAQRVVKAWENDHALQLVGPDTHSKREVAVAASHLCGCTAYLIGSGALPANPAELARFMRRWEREALLGGRVLVLDTDDDAVAGEGEGAQAGAAAQTLIAHLRARVIVLATQRRRSHGKSLLALEVDKPSLEEQQSLWRHALGDQAAEIGAGGVRELALQFNLNAPDIRSVCDAIGLQAQAGTLKERLWHGCRLQARLRLDELVQRIEPRADWDDLVLPEAERRIMRDIVVQVRHRGTVYQDWGFAAQGARGLGLVALFAGSSGTGKTMAAEVLAHTLRLDLYRVDLSAVVSKYIGETEKNLRLVFDAAEAGGAILLFDEADALFGKRTEVKDSHDRHANIEVSYLLQRMEAYPGLAILTTNLKESLDTAFLRRLRFVVQFAFPDEAQRNQIWRRVFPAAARLGALDYERLARLNIAGGNIRNIALHAAFLAAEAGQAIGMDHLLAGARNEYGKLERSLTDSEIRGWAA